MKTTAITLALLGLAVAGSAAAAPAADARISDSAYLGVARCHGLSIGSGVKDPALAAYFKEVERFRSPTARSRADQIIADAKRTGSHDKARAEAELAGACTTYREGAAQTTGAN